MKQQIFEFPLYPIPNQPNANGVLYPKAVLDKAIDEARVQINNNQLFVRQLGLAGSVPMYKDIENTPGVLGTVVDIVTIDPHQYKIHIKFLQSYQDLIIDNAMRIDELAFGMVTASSLTGFIDRRKYPEKTVAVVESIQQIICVHPINRSTKDQFTISQEKIVNEAKQS